MLQADFQLDTHNFHLHFTLEAEPEIVVVFGPSGAGKSLSLRALTGLIKPQAGVIVLGERTLYDEERDIFLPPQARRIGYVPQHFALFPHLTVAENIAYGLHNLPAAERRARVETLLELMRLEGFRNRNPREVSGGQQQRTALARALAREPDLLLMDEPFTALDEALRVHLRAELRRVQQQVQIPIIFITHDLLEAYSLADQLAVMIDGRVVQAGLRDEVFRSPHSPNVARLMGMSNIWKATVTELMNQEIHAEWNGLPIVITRPQWFRNPDTIRLGVRPEEVVIVRRGKELQPSLEANLLQGTIVEDRPRGFDHLLVVHVKTENDSNVRMDARIPHPVFVKLELALGQERTFSIKPSSIHVFP
jgi:molybdate transport system ATP-binding protein